MRFPTIIIGCLVTLATTARGVEEIRLFDGKTLDGWVAEGATSATVDGKTVPVWSVVDGTLHCQGKGFGFLRYDRQEFTDFTFHAEFKMAPKCNSGIGIRTRAFDPTQSHDASFLLQLRNPTHRRRWQTPRQAKQRLTLPLCRAFAKTPIKPPGQWNTIDITCVGPHIKVVLNEKTVIDVDQTQVDAIKNKPLKGYVCLQNHGGTIAFRELRVKVIEPPPG